MQYVSRIPLTGSCLDSRGRALALAALLLAATAATAQTAPVPPPPLPTVAENPNQLSMAQSIIPVCGNLRQTVVGGTTLPGDQQTLFNACAGILRADSGDASRSVALQELTGEELSAAQTTTVDFGGMQRANIVSRLMTLRSARGATAVASLSPADRDVFSLATGGAAGDGDTEGLGRLGVFLNGRVGSGSKDTTDLEAGYDVDTTGVTAGVDYRVSDQFVIGGALSYGNTEADFDSGSAGLSGGSTETDGYSLALFTSWYGERHYLDLIATFGQLDVESTRRVSYTLDFVQPGYNNPDPQAGTLIEDWDETARGETDSDLFSIGAGFGYDFGSGAWHFGPMLAINYLKVDVDGFTETGAPGLDLTYGDQEGESLQFELGVDAGYSASMSWGVLSPYARFTYVSEQENDSQVIDARFASDPTNTLIAIQSDDPDTNFFRWGVGLSALFANGFSAFIDYDSVTSLDTIDYGEVTAGVRFTFR